MQKEIEINNIKVPIIEEGGCRWYPISYIGKKVLLKDLSPSQLIQNGYGDYIYLKNIDYGENTGGFQKTFCLSEDGLKIVLHRSRIGRLTVNQKKAMNGLLTYLKEENILEDERFTKNVSQEYLLQFNEYIQDAITEVINNPNLVWQKCSHCNMYYPYHINFFRENPHSGKNFPLYTVCRDCCGWNENRGEDWIRVKNKELTKCYRNYGLDVYKLFKSNSIYDIWLWWKNTNYICPKILQEKDKVIELIKILYNHNIIVYADVIILKKIEELTKLKMIRCGITLNDIYNDILEIELHSKPGSGIDNFEDAKKVFLDYIKENNIEINYQSNLWNIIKDCGLITYIKHNQNDVIKFILQVFDYKMFGYKFNGGYDKHWQNQDNRDIALKQLIEKDMKIPKTKIPLYLTKENMRKQSNTLYYLIKKYYKNNIWLWVNEIYTDYFDEEDFNVTIIRNVFDSIEEHILHDFLMSKFKNVLYNQRNTENTIVICGMAPDWFIFTDNGIWIVEYFGITNERADSNKRIHDYQEKTLSKIEKYKKLSWLRKIYVYPDDLKDNFKGLEDKMKAIV